jgi:hypothetical protein
MNALEPHILLTIRGSMERITSSIPLGWYLPRGGRGLLTGKGHIMTAHVLIVDDASHAMPLTNLLTDARGIEPLLHREHPDAPPLRGMRR